MATDSFTRWPELDAIFAAALEKDAVERQGFLERSCGADLELRRELERLLSAAEASSEFLEDRAPLLQRLAEAHRSSILPTPEPGQRVGAYRLVREIGHGGMGVVYLAERADGTFEQKVALKLLGGWVRAPAELRRFQRERQILARVQHPNIARLLDGGVSEEGRPYFVMECVDGTAIDRYCDERRLTVRERLELFLEVCAAVELAHRNLVVHRDIKPGNVLVTAEGRPKLLDFGIARLLRDEEEEAEDAVTRTGVRPMTPEYASPEMVEGGPVGTASDIYQLGALLYQLLTGSPPHRLRGRSISEVERVVRTVEVERPSAAVTRAGADAGVKVPSQSGLALVRGTTPDRLRRRLRGDVDNIVLTALRKEPERRYGSVEQLASDVRRHLGGHPVRARPDTLAYRSSKFVLRHRFGVATAGLAAVLLVGFALAMAQQARRTAHERDRAEQVTRFLVDLFQSSDPDAVRGDTLTVRRVLEEGAQRVRTELIRQPEIRATLLSVIGGVDRSLGLHDEARPLLEEAVAIRRQVLDPDDPQLGDALSTLGLLLIDKGDGTAAEPILAEALRIARVSRGDVDTLVARTLNAYALALHVQGRVQEAESLYREASTIYRQAPGAPSVAYADALDNLGWILSSREDYAGADSVFGEALELRRRVLPAGHPAVARSLRALAYVREMEGRYPEAEALARESLELRRALYGEEHQIVADALLALAGSVKWQGRLDEAEALYRESLSVYERILGENTPEVAHVLANLGLTLRDVGRLDDAEVAMRRSLSIYRDRLGNGNVSTMVVANSLGSILERKERLEEAETLYRATLANARDAFPGDHPQVSRLLMSLGWLELVRGDAIEAEPHLREGLAMLRRMYPEGHVAVDRAQVSLGQCLVALQRYQEAEALLLEAYRRLMKVRGGDEPNVARARTALIRLYRESGHDMPEDVLSPGG